MKWRENVSLPLAFSVIISLSIIVGLLVVTVKYSTDAMEAESAWMAANVGFLERQTRQTTRNEMVGTVASVKPLERVTLGFRVRFPEEVKAYAVKEESFPPSFSSPKTVIAVNSSLDSFGCEFEGTEPCAPSGDLVNVAVFPIEYCESCDTMPPGEMVYDTNDGEKSGSFWVKGTDYFYHFIPGEKTKREMPGKLFSQKFRIDLWAGENRM